MVNDTTFLQAYFLYELAFLPVILWRLATGRPVFERDRAWMAPALIAAGVQAGVGLLQTGIGFAQKIKAAKMARRLVRPVLKDNAYLDQEYGYTASMAGQGLTDASRQAFITNNDRNVSASIDAITRNGGNMNNIGNVVEAGGNVLREMTLADQEIKARNQRNFLATLKSKADEDRDQFLVNEQAPFMDETALVAKLNQQGGDNAWKGINTMGGAAMGALDANMYAQRGNTAGAAVADMAAPPSAGGYMGSLAPMYGSSAVTAAPPSYPPPAAPQYSTLALLNSYFNRR